MCWYIPCQSLLIIKNAKYSVILYFVGLCVIWVEVSSAKIEFVKAGVSVEQSGEVV